MDNQRHMTSPKATNKISMTDPKEIEIYEQRIQNNPLKEIL